MPSRLDITAPATITVQAGAGTLSSLGALPPGGIVVDDPNSGNRVTVEIVSADGAGLSASGLAGATVSSGGGTLTMSGTVADVNAALASFEVTEPNGFSGDTLGVLASDPAVLADATAIAVVPASQVGPAFVGPSLLVTLKPNALDPVASLLLSDPIAAGIDAMGLGLAASLNLTLDVSAGVLLLPGYTPASPISAEGLGTGTLHLAFAAADIGALNTLLAGLEFAGPVDGEHLDYALRNLGGALPASLTYGNIYLSVAGTPGANGVFAAGSQTLRIGNETLSGTLGLDNTLAVLGEVDGNAAVDIGLLGDLAVPYNALDLGGTSFDDGTLAAATLFLNGTLVVAASGALPGEVTLGPGGYLEFAGLLDIDGASPADFDLALSLSAGAVVNGAGTLEAGNFSAAGLIEGPGTILAGPGETLLISAGSISGGTVLEVDAGGVIVLGPITPLYGVFNTTPLSIDSSVILSFSSVPGESGVAGAYAGALGGTGGAFVISGPQSFAATVEDFGFGDQLIFPGLQNITPFDSMVGQFSISGDDLSGNPVTYHINANIVSGGVLTFGLDAQGDPDIEVRPTFAILSQGVAFQATSLVTQPLLGLDLELVSNPTQSLTLTLAVGHGTLTGLGHQAAAKVTLTTAGLAAMNTALAGLSYTGTGVLDVLTISSSTGPLYGLLDYDSIFAARPVAVNAYSQAAYSEAQTALFTPQGGLPVNSGPVAAGEDVIAGTAAFTGPLVADGVNGAALIVDAGATGYFDANASATFAGEAIIGDASGPGTLAVNTDDFAIAGDLTLASDPKGGGSGLDIFGTVGIAGNLSIGAAGAAEVDVGGSLSAASTGLASTGVLFANGTAALTLGDLGAAGTVTLDGQALARASAVQMTGALALGGDAQLDVAGQLYMYSTPYLSIGADAALAAGSVVQSNGTINVTGTLTSAAVMTDAFVTLSSGSLAVGVLTIGGDGVFQGHGVVSAATIDSSGYIEVEGGLLTLGGSVINDGAIDVSDGELDLAGGVQGLPIAFLGAYAELTVNDVTRFDVDVQNMGAHDAIDLVGVAPGLVSYAGGVVSATDALGNLLTSFNLGVAANQAPLAIGTDGAGGTLLTLGDELPCFARGTGLLTPHGYRLVEALKPGDPVITISGAKRAVRWIGWRTLDLGPRGARSASPVLISTDAFGPGRPCRPLRLSPLHGVFCDGVLIPVTHLVNGATIRREVGAPAMTYFHIELDRHDVLVADGLPCESYLDTGNRGALYHEVGRRSPARRRAAPCVTSGARLVAVRKTLQEQAFIAGFSFTYWPCLRAIAGGATVFPALANADGRRVAVFALPAPTAALTLLAATACPSDTNPGSEDQRELGVCLAALPGVRLGDGWHARAAGDAGRWMGRTARLHLDPPVTRLDLPLAAIMQRWARVEVDAKPSSA